MPTLPEISKITIPSGTYALKDEVARSMAGGGIQLKGETTTPLTDMATTNPITINGSSYTAVNQDAVFYDHKEFVFDGTNWHEFGDLTGLGDLAMKDNVTGSTSYTPAGSVSQPSFTGSSTTSTGTYTPEGSVSAPTISVSSAGATTSVTPFGSAGTLPTYTVADETLTITAGTLPSGGTAVTVKTGDASYTASTPSFTGTEATISVSGTPTGTVSTPTFTGTSATISITSD